MNSSLPVLVASDVHLGSTPPEQEEAFFTWLEQASEAASWIILNGDVFDFWFEYRWGTTRGHDERLRRLRAVCDTGVPVTLMGGNHDWWGGRYLRDEIGIDFRRDHILGPIAGHRSYLTHGDGLGSGDTLYRLVVRPILHSPVTRFAFGMLPPRVGDRVAMGVSETEHRWGAPGAGERTAEKRLIDWADRYLGANRDVERVMVGHCHIPLARELRPGQWYINSGDWVYHRSYVVLNTNEDPRIEHWEGAIR